MPPVIASTVIHEFTPQQIKEIMAAQMGVPTHKVAVDFCVEEGMVQGMFSVQKIRVTVDNRPDPVYRGVKD